MSKNPATSDTWMMAPSKYRVMKVVMVLGPAAFSLGWGLDVYVPAIPHVMDDFHSTQRSIQLTFGMFMLFCGLGQVVFGPLSDHFGRRSIAIFSGLLFTFGSALCTFSTNVPMLVLSRIIEATGSCGLMVTAFAVIRDLFNGNEGASVYSYINSVISTAPIFGPIIGAYLDIWFGWRAVFVFLTGLGVFITALMVMNVSDTQIAYKQFSWDIVRRYRRIMANLNFLCFAFCAGVGLAVFFSFFSSSSFILIKVLKVHEAEFGLYFGMVGVIYMLGSLVGAQVALKIGVYYTCFIGALFVLAGTIAMLLVYLSEGLTLSGFLIPLFITKVGSPLLMGPGASGAMEPFPDMTGTASALLGCWQYLFAASVGTLVLQWEVHSNMPLCLTQLIMSVMTILVLVFNKETLLRHLVYKMPADRRSGGEVGAEGIEGINTDPSDIEVQPEVNLESQYPPPTTIG